MSGIKFKVAGRSLGYLTIRANTGIGGNAETATMALYLPGVFLDHHHYYGIPFSTSPSVAALAE